MANDVLKYSLLRQHWEMKMKKNRIYIEKPAILEQILNLFLITHPHIVELIHTLPVISDHDIPKIDSYINLNYNTKQSYKI